MPWEYGIGAEVSDGADMLLHLSEREPKNAAPKPDALSGKIIGYIDFDEEETIDGVVEV